MWLVDVIELIVWVLTLGYVTAIPGLRHLLDENPPTAATAALEAEDAVLSPLIQIDTNFFQLDRSDTLPQFAEEAAKKFGETLRSGMSTARRLAKPFLRIETEMDPESDLSEDSGASPYITTHYAELQRKRAMANSYIRNCLRQAPVEALESSFSVHACTWNVDQTAPPPYSPGLLKWLVGPELAEQLEQYHQQRQAAMTSPLAATPTPQVADGVPRHLLSAFPDMLIVSLQEVDMGGVALVKEFTSSSEAWTETIVEALHAASDREVYYKKLKMVQLVGLILLVLVKDKHTDYITHVRLSLTRTGAMRVLGNKGSVGMRATIYGRRFLFIAAHFAAHQHNEQRRTLNYHSAVADLRFEMPANTDDESEVLRTFGAARSVSYSFEESKVKGQATWARLFSALGERVSMGVENQVLDQHDYVFFLGDLNSRLHALSSGEIRQGINDRDYDYLLCHDELRQGMVSGEIFDGFQEQWIAFAPTYKYDRGTDSYDTSRKKRDPAWCDRVVYRVLENDSGTAADTDGVEGVPVIPSHYTPDSPTERNEWVDLNDIKQLAPTDSNGAEGSGTRAYERSNSSDTVSSTQTPQPHTLGQYPNEPSGSLGASFVNPTNPVWSKKRCAATFRAARRPTDLSHVQPRFPMFTNKVNALEYYRVDGLRQSDHRPVCARFEVKVISLRPDLVTTILDEVQEMFFVNDTTEPVRSPSRTNVAAFATDATGP